MRGWGTARGGLWRGDCWAGSRRTSRRPRGRGRRTERGASWSCRTYYQPAPWLQSFVSVFPLEMTDSATKGSSCLSGAIPGPGAPTPCRGCEALIKEAAEARDRAGQEEQRQGAGGRGQRPLLLPGRALPGSTAAPGAPPLRLPSFITWFLLAPRRTNSCPLLSQQVNALPLKVCELWNQGREEQWLTFMKRSACARRRDECFECVFSLRPSRRAARWG